MVMALPGFHVLLLYPAPSPLTPRAPAAELPFALVHGEKAVMGATRPEITLRLPLPFPEQLPLFCNQFLLGALLRVTHPQTLIPGSPCKIPNKDNHLLWVRCRGKADEQN